MPCRWQNWTVSYGFAAHRRIKYFSLLPSLQEPYLLFCGLQLRLVRGSASVLTILILHLHVWTVQLLRVMCAACVLRHCEVY